MRGTKLAARYAKALFDFALELNKVDEIFQDVNLIDKTFKENNELCHIINMPIVKTDKKIAIINQIFQSQISDITSNYLKLILKKGRETQIDVICSEFVKLYKKNKNIITLKITSVDTLPQTTIDTLVEKVKEFTQANIQVELAINPSIIGGYKLHFNDYFIDSSIKGSLDKLRKGLIDKSYQVNF